MISISRSIQVNCDPETLYRVLMDCERYPEFVAEIKKVEVIRRQTWGACAGNGKPSQGAREEIWTKQEARFFKPIRYLLHIVGEPFHRISWQEIRGISKYNEGSWILRSLSNGLTEVDYNITMEKGVFIPNLVVHCAIKWALPNLLQSFKRRAEAIYQRAPVLHPTSS